jgi:hypothetical protein
MLTPSHLRSFIILSIASPQQQQPTMSAISSPPINANLDQLKAEAVAMEGEGQHEEALAKYEEVLVIQQRDLPVGDPDTHETLMSIDRCIDHLKYASIDNFDVAKSADSLLAQSKHNESYLLISYLNKVI